MFFPGYNPFTKPMLPPEEVPEYIFKAARWAGASHLSRDGKLAYMKRYGLVYQAEQSGQGFGAWLPCESIPADAVELP